MFQVVASITKKSHCAGSEDQCRKYIDNYALEYGSGDKEFQVLPFDPKRKIGDFAEQMQIQLGHYRPVQEVPETDTEAKKKIAEIIGKYNEGIKRHQLLSLLSQKGYPMADRKLRSFVEDLINSDGYAIESSEDGYRMIHTAEQLRTAIKYLKNKAFPLFERANNMQKNFYRDRSRQLSFEEFFTD